MCFRCKSASFVCLNLFTMTLLMVMSDKAPYDHHQTLCLYGTQCQVTCLVLTRCRTFGSVDTFVDTVLPTEEGGSSWFQAPLECNSSMSLNFQTIPCLRTPITLWQSRGRLDSCEVNFLDIVEDNNLYSSILVIDTYVSRSKEINYQPPPVGCDKHEETNMTWGFPWGQRSPGINSRLLHLDQQ